MSLVIKQDVGRAAVKVMQHVRVAGAILVLNCFAYAQMPSPDMDRADRPFSYFAKSTDQIGVSGAPSGSEITPEGFLYTGFGEFMFFVGSNWAPLDSDLGGRIRTLDDGYIPIENYDVERDGLTYHFTMFSASLGKQPDGPVANFVRVTVENKGTETRAAFLSTAMRYQAPLNVDYGIPDDRFKRPLNPAQLAGIRQPGEEWNPGWIYGFDGDAFLRDHRVLYLFSQNPKPILGQVLTRRYNTRPTAGEGKLPIQPTTPVGVAHYSFPLAPGEHRSLDFKIPLIPIEKASPEIQLLESASFDDYRERVRNYWRSEVSKGMSVTVPEEKANDLFRTCLVNDLLSLSHIGDDWIQAVNLTHYHGFWLRDSADFVHMYDVTGYPSVANRVLRFYAHEQQPDGNFLSQKGEFDGWGQTLWIYGFHYRITHDQEFAERVYPSVLRAVDWFEKATASDPLHLMPATDVRDAEYIPGHLTGYNFLALDGLQGAMALGRGLGKTEDVARFQKDYDELHKNFLAKLDQRAGANRNVIPPALDGDMSGANWGNLLGVTPEPQLDPHDPKITATLKAMQSHYGEGLIIYTLHNQGDFMHHYLTIKDTLTEVARGDQEQAMREYYALLLHTSSTNSGFEYAIRPWGNRDFEGNLAPHGWFAADFRNLMRSMLLREENDDTLHLLSVVSPAWVGLNKTIKVERAPTMFGEVGFELVSLSDTSAELKLHTSFGSNPPKKMVIHIPWFMQLASATVDGVPVRSEAGVLEVPPSAHLVKFVWHRNSSDSSLSYTNVVNDYKADYRKHYDEYRRTGIPFVQ